jgi:indolepyruvate ferredoxin oxidoreductase
MGVDPRFIVESGPEVFTGNELLVKGCLEVEGGLGLMTGYPGSPVAGFFDTMGDLAPLLQKHGVRAFQANNEALAAAALNGSQMAPIRGIIAMKNVGLHVAADALALGNLAGAHPQGGAVVICGEDPWCDSTQVPADSRFLCEHLRMPVVEPGNGQQVKDWINLSFKLSQSAGLFIGYIITTAHADGGGTAYCKTNQWPALNTNDKVALDTPKIDLNKLLLPPRTWQEELKIPARFETTMKAARELGINRIEPRRSMGVPPMSSGENQEHGRDAHATVQGKAPLGFIVTGMGGPYLRHVLADIGLGGHFPILQMGMSYPVDVKLVAEFSQLCDKMIVIEERRSFLEKGIRDEAFHKLPNADAMDLVGRLYGKTFPHDLTGIPDARGLNPSVLAQIIIPLIKATEEVPPELRNGKLSAELLRLRVASKPKLNVLGASVADHIVPRTPTFCPGCPHRDSSAALLEIRKNFQDPAYMLKHHGTGPVDMVAHGDTGCYTMLMFAPTEQLMHNYSGMGLGAGTGSGIDPFITNKQIVFMGDGTFFHSGQIAISNAIKAGQDITFIILENGTTAMTGHQEHAGTEVDLLGNRSYIQNIEEICRSFAGTSPLTVVKLRPERREQYKNVLEKTIISDGVKVIIADKECGITYNRTQLKEERKTIKKHGYLPKKTHMNVTPEVCEHCLECTKATACPGLTTVETDYGRKIDTDLTWCTNDGACERVTTSNDAGTNVKPCPSFEQITVVRKKRRRYMLPHMALDKLPDPVAIHDLSTPGAAWRAHMAGVGGMGIGVVNAILVRAGHKEGYRVLFQDKKGLAIRNGGVYSQITFVKDKDADDHRSMGVSTMSSAESKEHGRDAHATVAGDAAVSLPPEFATTGAIPYAKADLLLGIDILEAARAIDPREPFRIAHKDRTCAVLNTHKQPTVFHLLGKSDFDPEQLRQDIFDTCRVEHSYAKNLSELCEQRLGSKQYMNIMMLGVAFQLGLIPVSAHSIAWAIKDSIRRDHRKNLKAFNIGRKLALEPRALPKKPQAETWEQLVTNKVRIIRKSVAFGRHHAMRFEKIVQGAMKQFRDLPEEPKYDLTLRIYDLMQYEGATYAKRYLDAVRTVYKRDLASPVGAARSFAATQAAIWNLAKVMLIKDEPYVAYLLTRFEKKQRDIHKYGVDVSNGDRIVYRHHTSPEFNVGPWRLRLKITTSDWQLNIVRHMKWWRKLPGWHSREVQFREWYFSLLNRVSLIGDDQYEQALRVLRCPEEVSGYREVRYPKMDRAKAMVEAELSPVVSDRMTEQKPELDLRTATRV